jgi:hypothetical protein
MISRALLIALVFASAAFAQEAGVKPESPKGNAVEPEPVSMDQLDAPLEQNPAVATEGDPDRSKELQQLMESAISAARKNDSKKLREIAISLKLPDSQKWFVEEFGTAKGNALHSDYKYRLFEQRLPIFFHEMVSDGSTVVTVTCVDHNKDKDGTWGQRSAIGTMTSPLKLYSVHFLHPGAKKGFHVFSFAYVDGGMRCVGRLGVFSEQ